MRRKWRKCICTAVAAVITAGMLSGCSFLSGEETAQNGREQTVRISMYNDIAYSDWRTYVEKQFPDTTFIWENNRNSTQNLIYQAKHDDMADIVMIRRFESDSAGELAPYLMDLGGDGLASTFTDGSLDPFTFDGRVCWFPAPGMAEGIYANASLFERCGIRIPETTSELEEACRKFHEQGIEGLGVESSLGYRAVLLLEGFNYSGWFSTEEGRNWRKSFLYGDTAEIPEEGCRQLASALRDMKKNYVIDEHDQTLETADMSSEFDSEKAAMFISGSDLQYKGKTDSDIRIIPCLGNTKEDQVLFIYPVFSTAVSERDSRDPERKALMEKILKVMYSSDAQQILAKGTDALFSYNRGVELPVSDLYKPVSGLFSSGRYFMRFLNRNFFAASTAALQDIIEDDASDDAFGKALNEALSKPLDKTVIGTSDVEADNQSGATWPLVRSAASVLAQTVRDATDADIVLIEGKSAAAPVFKGDYTEADLNAVVADDPLYEGTLTGTQLNSVFDDAILATTTYRYHMIEPLVDYPAISGMTALLYSDGKSSRLVRKDGSSVDPSASYSVVISKTILDALQYLQDTDAAAFSPIDETLQSAFRSRLSSGSLPKPEQYFKVEVSE